MKTVNRGTLKKLALAGKLVAVDSYHFDDQLGESRSQKELPVRIGDYGDWKDGCYNMHLSDFEGKGGRAWENQDGTITLYIHSNSNVTLKKV